MSRSSKVAQLPFSHYAQWEDYYTVQIAQRVASVNKTNFYKELEFLVDKPKSTIAPRISRGQSFSDFRICSTGLIYLEEFVIPSIDDIDDRFKEKMWLINLKEKIKRSSYEEFHGEPMPSLESLMTKPLSISFPKFVYRMLMYGVFNQFETKIQVDKTGLFQKEISPLMNANYLREYFFGI